jgi:hypothetical protein
MTVRERMLRRMRAEGVDLPEDTELVRIYAGWAMKSRGCWSWFAHSPSDAHVNIGSHYTMTELLRMKRWLITTDRDTRDTSIDPFPGDERVNADTAR